MIIELNPRESGGRKLAALPLELPARSSEVEDTYHEDQEKDCGHCHGRLSSLPMACRILAPSSRYFGCSASTETLVTHEVPSDRVHLRERGWQQVGHECYCVDE